MISDTFFLGEKERIAICLDNASWHNKLTEESVIPKCASTKGETHVSEKNIKAQLLELVGALSTQ